MQEQAATIIMPDRRERFRAFMRRFNPSAQPRQALKEQIICRNAPHAAFKKLAAGADLNIGSQQLLVGGIGSGKTIELLLAEEQLSQQPQPLPLYIDISRATDLSAVSSGALLAALGIRAGQAIFSSKAVASPPEALIPIIQEIKKSAYGDIRLIQVSNDDWMRDEDDGESDDSNYHWETHTIPAKLPPRFPAMQREIRDLAGRVSQLIAFLKEGEREPVAIFDGLDRLLSAGQFWALAEQDFRAMKSFGVSIIAAGPLSVMYGKGREVKDYFDEVFFLPPAIADPQESPFLMEVLRLRGADELMGTDEMANLCLASGGVLRDLISLARAAGENAYLEDADQIGASHVDQAIGQLGNSYLMGLSTRQRVLLSKMLQGDGFAPSDADGMELLITRRVLARSESRYEVHPALAALLAPASRGPV